MGTWGTAIKSNDVSADIYSEFFDLYNKGEEPTDIAEKLIVQNQELIKSQEDSNNFWFAIALSLWETKKLNREIFEKVKEIIESSQDIKLWKELDADKQQITKREKALSDFLEKISVEKAKPKARKKSVFKTPIFEKGTCLTYNLELENYGAAIVLESDNETGSGTNLIATTRINQKEKPTIEDVLNAEILVLNAGDWNNSPNISWYAPDFFKKQYSDKFEIIGTVEIEKNYSPNEVNFDFGYSGGWNHIYEPIKYQLDYEKENGKSERTITVLEMIKKRHTTSGIANKGDSGSGKFFARFKFRKK